MLLLKQALVRNTFRSDPLRYTEHGWRWFLGRGHDLSTRSCSKKKKKKRSGDACKSTYYCRLLVSLPSYSIFLRSMIYDGRLHLRFPVNLFRLVRRCKLDDMMHRFLQTIERNSSFFGKRNGQIFMFKIFDINLKFQIWKIEIYDSNTIICTIIVQNISQLSSSLERFSNSSDFYPLPPTFFFVGSKTQRIMRYDLTYFLRATFQVYDPYPIFSLSSPFSRYKTRCSRNTPDA